MNDTLSLAMVGIGGHGDIYLKGLFAAPPSAGFRFVAAVDPEPRGCRCLPELEARGVPVYPSLEAFYAAEHADVVVLVTPPFLHGPQICYALAHGSHVFCEKPLGTHPQQVQQMLRAQRQAGRQVAIGYQWSFSPAIQSLKRDIAAGRLGCPRRLKSLILWPRSETYYRRNRWAGRLRDESGNWICDSPLNNACAHYLHNMLYVLGDSPDRSAWPAEVSAELYRAYPIENYDTAALRCVTQEGVEIFCVASHVTQTRQEPVFFFEFDDACVSFEEGGAAPITARFHNGEIQTYGVPHDGYQMHKVWRTLSAIRQGTSVLCGIEAAASQTACMWAAQRSTPQVTEFPSHLIGREQNEGVTRLWVEGLAADLERCYQRWRLPAELGLSWSRRALPVAVAASLDQDLPRRPSSAAALRQAGRPAGEPALTSGKN